MEAAEIRAAARSASIRTGTLCVALATVLTLLEQIRKETPGWQVWKSTPVIIAIGVLKGIQGALCGSRGG